MSGLWIAGVKGGMSDDVVGRGNLFAIDPQFSILLVNHLYIYRVLSYLRWRELLRSGSDVVWSVGKPGLASMPIEIT